jgi:tetratricopeptide (TPR) repeat protein
MREADLAHEALTRGAAERDAFLTAACGGDAALRRRVETLLRAAARRTQPGKEADTATPVTVDFVPAAPAPPEPPLTQVFDPAAPAAASTGGWTGLIAGRYRLLDPLGEGGMGTVWLAEQLHPVRRKVALKLIKAGMDSVQVVARFDAERQTLAMMDHPNIAKVLDAGLTEDRCPFFVMEHVPGVPLNKYCDAKKLTLRARLGLFITVCHAVQHAHQKGIIHRDLKPSNILVADYDGQPMPKVIDFGVAKATGQKLSDATMNTAAGAVIGTLEYMSPEQAGLHPLDVDTRSDIYSLGVILYELLVGLRPMEAARLKKATFPQILMMICEEEPLRPSVRLRRHPQLPDVAALRQVDPRRLPRLCEGDLDWIVMKALEKDRNRRYDTANGLAQEVRRHLADEPVLAGPPSTGYRAAKFLRRHRGPVLAAAGLAVALVAGIVGTAWGLLVARQEADHARKAELTMRAERDAKDLAQKDAETKRREAETQAAIARAINDFFLGDLLELIDPTKRLLTIEAEPRTSKLTVVELLERARSHDGPRDRFQNMPEVRVAVLRTLGNAFRAVAKDQDAGFLLANAVEHALKNLGPDHAETLASRLAQARWAMEQGRYGEVEKTLADLLPRYERRFGPDHAETLACRGELGLVLQVLGHYDRAEPFLRAAYRAADAQFGPADVRTLANQVALGNLLIDLGRFEEATATLAAAQKANRAGTNHPVTLRCESYFALAYAAAGKYDAAEAALRQALASTRNIFGEQHAETTAARLRLGELLLAMGQYDAAEPLLVYGVTLSRARRNVLSHEPPANLRAFMLVARLFRLQGRFEDALEILPNVLAAQADRWGFTPDTLATKAELVLLYQADGQTERAVTLGRELLDEGLKRYSAQHPLVRQAQLHLGQLLAELGQDPQADELAAAALRTTERLYGPHHVVTQATQAAMARIKQTQRRWDAAQRLLQTVVDQRVAAFGPTHPLTLAAKADLAHAISGLGQRDQAAAVLRDVVGTAKDMYGWGHPWTQEYVQRWAREDAAPASAPAVEAALRAVLAGLKAAQSGRPAGTMSERRFGAAEAALGECLLGQRKFAAAEPLLRSAWQHALRTRSGHWSSYHLQAEVGAAMLGLGKHADAEPLLLSAYQGLRNRRSKMPVEEQPKIAAALDLLIQACAAGGKLADVARWTQERHQLALPEAKR